LSASFWFRFASRRTPSPTPTVAKVKSLASSRIPHLKNPLRVVLSDLDRFNDEFTGRGAGDDPLKFFRRVADEQPGADIEDEFGLGGHLSHSHTRMTFVAGCFGRAFWASLRVANNAGVLLSAPSMKYGQCLFGFPIRTA